jgi:actin-related protein
MEETPLGDPVVFDYGSKYTRIGFSGDDQPRDQFATLHGRVRGQGVVVGFGVRTHYVGREAEERCGNLWLEYPVKEGKVVNHDCMVIISSYDFCLSTLRKMSTIIVFTMAYVLHLKNNQ